MRSTVRDENWLFLRQRGEGGGGGEKEKEREKGADKDDGKEVLDMEAIDRSMVMFPSDRTTISCGTVTLDPRTGQVLLILNKKHGIYQLPKGRKNIGEGLPEAAVRETFEETGVRAELMPLKIATRATTTAVRVGNGEGTGAGAGALVDATAAAGAAGANDAAEAAARERNGHRPSPPAEEGKHAGAGRTPQVTRDSWNSEFVGMVQYPDPQSTTRGTIKNIFFFAARADSAAQPPPLSLNGDGGSGKGSGAQEDWEDFDAVWASEPAALGKLRFEAERAVLARAFEIARESGYEL